MSKKNKEKKTLQFPYVVQAQYEHRTSADIDTYLHKLKTQQATRVEKILNGHIYNVFHICIHSHAVIRLILIYKKISLHEIHQPIIYDF